MKKKVLFMKKLISDDLNIHIKKYFPLIKAVDFYIQTLNLIKKL